MARNSNEFGRRVIMSDWNQILFDVFDHRDVEGVTHPAESGTAPLRR